MSLAEIGDILAGPEATRGWNEIVKGRIEALGVRIEQMVAAREFLDHILSFHHHAPPDGCEHYESLIWDRDPGENDRVRS